MDDGRIDRHPARYIVQLNRRDRLDRLSTIDGVTERAIVTIERRGSGARKTNEELAPGRIDGQIASHGDHAEIVRQLARLDGKPVSRPAVAGAGRVAGLYHERFAGSQERNNPMEGHAVVESAVAKLKKVPNGVGRMIGTHRETNLSFARMKNDVALGIDAQASQKALPLVVG